MSNLYGGQPGSKFVLKGNFASVDDMIAAFKLGANYTNVWYEEYCIIDTVNKNHKDNGKIYRRGYEYTNSTGGAEYIGQVVGPRSGTPYMQINTLEQAHERSLEILDEGEYRQYPYGQNADGTYLITDEGQEIADFIFTRNDALVPGRDESGAYNDAIKWTWVNIRRDNEETGSWFYVGLEIPYLVIDYDAVDVSPYDENGQIKSQLVDIVKLDDGTHPYYESYNFEISRGIKGDTLRNLRVIVPTANDVIYDPSAITILSDGVTQVGLSGYDGQQDDIDNQRQILVYDYYYYDFEKNPDAIMIYLGDYNQEKGISLDDDGTLTFSQTHNDDIVFEKKIRWINDVILTSGDGENGGHFSVEYNNGDPAYEVDITWIKNMIIEEDGSVVSTFAGAGDEQTDSQTGIRKIEKLIKWLKDVSLTSGNGSEGGHIKVEYNNDSTPYETDITWPKNIEISEDGTITTTFAGAGDALTDSTTGIRTYTNLLKWISQISLNTTNGILEIGYNNNSPSFTATLDWIRRITLDDDGTIHFLHTANEYDEVYNQKLRWITNASLNTTNGLFTVEFNNGSNLTATLDYVSDLNIDEESGNITLTHINSGDTVLAAKLKKITSASVTSNGVVTLYDNTGNSFNLQREDGNGDYHWRSLDGIRLNTELTADKHIMVKYNDLTEEIQIGNSLNWIHDIVVRNSDYHLLVLFTDPSHRATAADLDANGKDSFGNTWVQNIVGSDGVTTSTGIFWRDYGAIKDQSGVMIGTNITENDVITAGYTDVLDYLLSIYPNGITGAQAGKIVTYSAQLTDAKEFYAYDYNNNRWYFLGTISDGGNRDVALNIGRVVPAETINEINTRGLIFKIVKTTKTPTEDLITSAMPKFWAYNYTWM